MQVLVGGGKNDTLEIDEVEAAGEMGIMYLVEEAKNCHVDKDVLDEVDIKSNLEVKVNAEITSSFRSQDTRSRINNQKSLLQGDLNNILEFKEEEFNFDNYEDVDDKKDIDLSLSISDKSIKKKKNQGNEQTDVNCNICSLNFQSYNKLRFHRRKTHPSPLKNVLCDVCGKVFSTFGIRNTHMKTVHLVSKPYSCDQCDKSFSTSGIRKTHMRNRHSEGGALQLTCEECGKMFRHAGSLNIHVEHAHRSWEPSPCPQCGMPVRYLKNHMRRKHSTIRKYGCEECGKRFKTKSDLTKHQKSHLPADIRLLLNEKQKEKNQCHDCGQGFTDSTKLRRHVASTHTGIRSFFCKECPAAYFRPDHLKNHVVSNHKQSIINLF